MLFDSFIDTLTSPEREFIPGEPSEIFSAGPSRAGNGEFQALLQCFKGVLN
jgi:hypothetical protein